MVEEAKEIKILPAAQGMNKIWATFIITLYNNEVKYNSPGAENWIVDRSVVFILSSILNEFI